MNGLFFEVAPAIAAPSPNRTDIACFVGFVARRRGRALPRELRAWLAAAGWTGGGPYARAPGEVESLTQIPIPVESWDMFDRLFAWDERPLDGRATCATYLGAAVRSFFANGGRRCYVVRAGDPWRYSDPASASDADRRAAQRRARVRALVPGFSDRGEPEFAVDPTDPRTWRGIVHLHGLPDVSFLCLPDLPDACGVEPEPIRTAREVPQAPEVFTECSVADTAMQFEDKATARYSAPRCDSHGYGPWRFAVGLVRDFLARYRRDALFVGALPLPVADARRPGHAGALYAEADLLRFLERAGVLTVRPAGDELRRTTSSAFVQLAYPWLRTRVSGDLPEQLEAPDGTLAGMLAANALARGTFHSAAGLPAPEIYDTEPRISWGGPTPPEAPKSPLAELGERLCLVAPTPTGWVLYSDVTTAADSTHRPGGVSRLVGAVLRAARRVGEDALFEPSGPRLWQRVQRAMEDLMTAFWREGALNGASAEDAFEVRCDRTTMTQNDIDNGRVVARVAFTPAASVERITVTLMLAPGSVPVAGLGQSATQGVAA